MEFWDMVFGFLGGSVCVGSVGGMAPRVYTQGGGLMDF